MVYRAIAAGTVRDSTACGVCRIRTRSPHITPVYQPSSPRSRQSQWRDCPISRLADRSKGRLTDSSKVFSYGWLPLEQVINEEELRSVATVDPKVALDPVTQTLVIRILYIIRKPCHSRVRSLQFLKYMSVSGESAQFLTGE